MHLSIDPGDVDLLGPRKWDSFFFVDLLLPFYFCLALIFIPENKRSICYIMKHKGHTHLLNYIHDLC